MATHTILQVTLVLCEDHTNRIRENRSRELGKLVNTVLGDEYCSLSKYWDGGDTEKQTDMQYMQE